MHYRESSCNAATLRPPQVAALQKMKELSKKAGAKYASINLLSIYSSVEAAIVATMKVGCHFSARDGASRQGLRLHPACAGFCRKNVEITKKINVGASNCFCI